MSDPIAAIRKRVAAWGREDSRVLLAEIDRLRPAEQIVRDIVATLPDGPAPGMLYLDYPGGLVGCPGCVPYRPIGQRLRHEHHCPIARAIAYVAAQNATTGEG